MITEDYVSFEIARLLKKKGFDEKCQKVYMHNGQLLWAQIFMEGESFVNNKDIDLVANYNDWNTHTQGEYAYLCPTLQMAIKWLRKVHQIFIRPNISFLYPIRYYCEIFCYGDNLKTQQDVTTENFESPEQACEAAVKYCLKNFDLNNYDNN